MAHEWFIYSDSVVTGPFSTEQVEQCLSAGIWSSSCFIWWKGQREWMPISSWEAELSNILKADTEKVQTPVWYVDIGGSSVGPLTQSEMLTQLRGISNLSKVRLWSVGLDKWTNIFELHDVMEELGLSRRENERAPLMGTVAISRADQQGPIITKAASISIAGMGLSDSSFLVRGEQIQLIIKSTEFPQPLRVTGHVAYVTAQGYAGIRFDALHPETHTLVFDYVRRFNVPAQKAS